MISIEASTTIISRLMSLSLASRKIKCILVTQENGNIHEYHPPINLYLYAKRGSMKSTMAKQAAKMIGAEVITNATAAAMEGTIDKENKGAVRSVIWEMRNKALILDEFNMGQGPDARPVKGVILQVSEGGQLSKTLGIRIGKDIELKEGDEYFKVRGNLISLKVIVPVMLFTMNEPRIGDNYDEALQSRFVMYQYYISKSDVRKVLKGNRLLNIEDIDVKSKVVRISTSTYNKIIEYVDRIIDKRDDEDLYLRILQDCCKVYAVLRRHSEYDYRLIIELRLSHGQLLQKEVNIAGELEYTEESLQRVAEIVRGLKGGTKQCQKKKKARKHGRSGPTGSGP